MLLQLYAVVSWTVAAYGWKHQLQPIIFWSLHAFELEDIDVIRAIVEGN